MRGRSAAFHLLAPSAVAAVLIAIILCYRVDISAIRYFRGDTIVRDSWPERTIHQPPYFDPSAWTIWIPSDLFVRESIRAGHLPLWDRMQGGGYSPVLAVQNGVFHPVRWVLALVSREAAPSVLIVIVTFLGLTGMLLLLRAAYGLTTAAAYVGATLYAFSSALLAMLHFSGASLPLAHLPWIALALLHAQRRGTVVAAIPLALGLASLMVSGHPLLITAVLVAAAGIAVVEAWEAQSLRPVVLLAACTGGAACLTAFALVPPIASRGDLWSYKTESHFGSVYAPFYPLSQWLHAVGSIVIDRHRHFLDDTRFAVTMGPAAVLLALTGAFTGLAHRRGAGLFLLLIGLGMLALPGPWMAEVAAMRPLTYMNRAYFAGAFAFVFVLAAARGFDFLRVRGGAAAAVAILLGIVASAESLARAWRVAAPAPWEEVVRGDVVRFLRGNHSFFRITGFIGSTHLPNVSRITGIEDVRLAAPILPVRAHLWWLAVDPRNRRFVFPTMRVTDRLDSALVGDFNIAFVLQSRIPAVAGMNNAVGARDKQLSEHLRKLPLVMKTPSVELRAIPDFKPRAHVAKRVVTVPDRNAAVALLTRDRHLARDTAVVEGRPLSVPANAIGEVTVRYPDDLHAVLDVVSTTGGLVVLHDSYDRGWQARVDGTPTAILPVNILSRGVVVPPGRHRIIMEYRPPGFAGGVAVSAIAVIVLAVIAAGALLSDGSRFFRIRRRQGTR